MIKLVKENLTLEMLLYLPDKIINMSNNSYISLLEKETYEYHYYSGLRNDLLKIFNKFNDVKYSLSYDDGFSITGNYEFTENQKQLNNIDSVSNYVEKRLGLEGYALKVYKKIISLSRKLTKGEAIYFVNTFFAKKSEEYISERLEISRTYLQKIKKSCLVKTYLEFYDMLKRK